MFPWVFAGYTLCYILFITPLFVDPVPLPGGGPTLYAFVRGPWIFLFGWLAIITTAFGEATFSIGYDHSNFVAFLAVPIYAGYVAGLLVLILIVPTERGVPPIAELLMNITHVEKKAELAKSMNTNPSSPTFDANKFYGSSSRTSRSVGEANLRADQLSDHINTVDAAISGLQKEKAALNRARAQEAELEAKLNQKIEEAEKLKAELEAHRKRRW